MLKKLRATNNVELEINELLDEANMEKNLQKVVVNFSKTLFIKD